MRKFPDSEPAANKPERPVWLFSLIILVLLSTTFMFLVYTLTGGKEIGDDAGHLIVFVRNPLVLWGNYGTSGLTSNWGSFPPLLPLLFGILVFPWLMVLPDFWALRMGILSWSIVVMFGLYLIMDRVEKLPARKQRTALLIFALLPSVWAPVALIPEEETYVSLFVLALYLFIRKGWWKQIIFPIILTALAGKYFLLILVVPLALMSPKPIRYFALWAGASVIILSAHVAYHRMLFGLTPILDHSINPGSSLSLWALAWNLGFRISEQFIKLSSTFLTIGAVTIFGLQARRKLPPAFMMTGILYITLLCISITVPAYVLWVLPLMLVCAVTMKKTSHLRWSVALMFLWGICEWGANFFRGIALALGSERPIGKTMVARFVQRIVGENFPYSTFQIACLIAVIASGAGIIYLLWKSGSELLKQNAREELILIQGKGEQLS